MRILNLLIFSVLLGLTGCAQDAAAKQDESQNPAVENVTEAEAREVQLETERSEPLMEAADERDVIEGEDEPDEKPE